MKMYHIGLLPCRRCGTFFTENISDTFLLLIRHFATCFVLKNVKRKKRREEDAIEGDLWDTYCVMMAVSFEKRIKSEKKAEKN